MEFINVETWPRREVFQHFSSVSDPFYAVCFEEDVTEVYRYVKLRGLSFYLGMVWLCNEAINDVENFRYAIRDGCVALLDRREPSFTDMHPGSEIFHIVTLPAGPSLDVFCRAAAEKSRAQKVFLDQESETDDLVYFSCTPGLALTALTNEFDRADPHMRDDTVPRVAWGRFAERDGHKYLTLCLEVNHRFIDGLHVTRFAQALERRIAALNTGL